MTLLFLHGAGCSSEVFRSQSGAFPDAEFVNLPGHFCEGSPSTIAAFSDWIEAWSSKHNAGALVLCGHSMGGAIALECALRHSSGLRGIVLLGGSARLRVAPQILAGVRDDLERTAAQLAQSYFFADPKPELVDWITAMMSALGPQVLRDFQACNAFDVLDRLHEISVPLLAVSGELDKMTPPKFARALADRVPGATTRILAGAGHFVMVERPQETNAAISSFVSTIA